MEPDPHPELDELDSFVDVVADDQLRLMFLCCHPALGPDAQVALTLRLLGGFETTDIAGAFLVPEATMAQRLVRAKRKLRDNHVPVPRSRPPASYPIACTPSSPRSRSSSPQDTPPSAATRSCGSTSATKRSASAACSSS